MTRTFTNAIHLVSCESAGGHVKQVVKPDGDPRTNLKILSEQLTVGPCDVDPVRHVELRRAWNAEIGDEYLKTFGLEDLRAAVAGDRPVVIWATRAYRELVWFWWIMDGLGRIGQFARPPILVQPKPDDPRETVGGTPPKRGRVALAVARAISDDEIREGAELWKLFASPDPRVFDEARRRGSPVFPELRESADLHGDWFPRLEAGRLRLAENDERLLASLTDEWLITWEVNITKAPGWERLVWTSGGLVAFWRLRQWAAHGVVAREVRDNYDSDKRLEFELTFFRRTERTRALLAHGLEGVGNAPSIYVGGCRINDYASPWVRVVDGSDWRIIPTRDDDRSPVIVAPQSPVKLAFWASAETLTLEVIGANSTPSAHEVRRNPSPATSIKIGDVQQHGGSSTLQLQTVCSTDSTGGSLEHAAHPPTPVIKSNILVAFIPVLLVQ